MKTLYTIQTLRNTNTVKSLILAAALMFISTFTFAGPSIPELVFKNAALSTGTAGSDGAIYRFSNVTSSVDALVTINGRSDVKVTLSTIDLTGTGYDNAFQPQISYNGGSAPKNTSWYMEFQISFVKSGTLIPSTVTSFNVTGLDIDGDGKSLFEYLSFYGLTNYTLEKTTAVTVSNIMSGTTLAGKEFDGSTTSFGGIDATATTIMETNLYNSTNSFKVRVGAKNGSSNSSSTERMSSLWFKSFSFSNAIISTLPVDLISFDAKLVNDKVNLSWITANEINLSKFELERSTNGSDYETVAVLFANGNSASELNYAYRDNISEVKSSVIYYRLKMVDLDGKSKYSLVRVIRLSNDQQVNVVTFPNPAVNEIHVTVPAIWQMNTVTYSLYSINGNLVKQQTNNHASQTETINISNLQAGMYMLKVSGNNQTAVQQIVKTK